MTLFTDTNHEEKSAGSDKRITIGHTWTQFEEVHRDPELNQTRCIAKRPPSRKAVPVFLSTAGSDASLMEIVPFILHTGMHGTSVLHILIKIKSLLESLSRKQHFGTLDREGEKMNWVYMKGIPIEAQYLFRKALEYSDHEQYETAVRYFRQAVVIAPRYSKAFYEMANCLAFLGKYDEAIAVYDRVIAIDPVLTEARIHRDMVVDTRERNINHHQFIGTSTV